MKTYLLNIKYIVLVAFISMASCISDDLADVGDLEDITGPTPFYNFTEITTSEFDCEEVELWAKYEFNFQGGSNLAVNGTMYEWVVKDSDGNTIDNLPLVNPDFKVLELLIDAQLASVVAIQEDIADLEFKIPCEEDADKAAVLETELAALEVALEVAEDGLSDQVLDNVADLEAQKDALIAATLQDQELIIEFPEPGVYTVGLTVTDNLGKSDYTETLVTVNQAVPTIPIPEIGEPGFDDNTLFDGTGDGRDSWRAPSSSAWGSVFQINTKSELGILPDGLQAAKFPADGTRVGYQEIEVTPGATYVLTYFSAFEENAFGDLTVSIINPETSTLVDAQLEANIIASRTDDNEGRVADVFKQHAITFEAGEYESVVILLTNSGVESRLDAFAITVKQ